MATGRCGARCGQVLQTCPVLARPAARVGPVTISTLTSGSTRTARVARSFAQLFRFAWLELQCCLFPLAIFAGLALSAVLPLPIARYDALLIYAVSVTAAFYLLGLETRRELAIIGVFHLVGLALEIFKVHVGSWSYPDEGLLRVGGVPLYSGFMYAAVASYICQAFRRMQLRVVGLRPLSTAVLAVAAYVNFFSHHVLPDLRWWIAAGFVLALWGCTVAFTVGERRYRMPLAVSFVLIGFFLWVAENAGTLLGGWRYPNQAEIWEMVHTGKWGSWALLVSLSFMLVAVLKTRDGSVLTRRASAGPSGT